MNQNVLSQSAISEIFSMGETERGKVVNVDFNLQVVYAKQKDNPGRLASGNHVVYTSTISDGDHKYSGFVIFVDHSQGELEYGDIIKIKSISINVLQNQANKVIVVKKLEILEKNCPLVGNPENIVREGPGSKERGSMNQGQAQGGQGHGTSTRVNQGQHNQSFNQPRASNQSGYPTNNNYQNNLNQSSSYYDDEEGYNNHNNQNNNSYNKKSFYHPIASLTTFSKDTQLLVRIINKTEVKHFAGKTGGNPGNLFSFTMMDADGSEMQATCFNKASEKFFDLIQENDVFEIHGGSIRINDRKFANSKGDYKMIIEESTRIEKKKEEHFPKPTCNFVAISDIPTFNPNVTVDVFGYVVEAGDSITKTTKWGKEANIRKLIIVDLTEYKIELTLWKAHAMDDRIQVGKVISVKNARVGDFNGRSLSTVDETKIMVHPDDDRLENVIALKQMAGSMNREWKTFNSVVGGVGGNADSAQNAPISSIKETLAVLDSLPDDKIPTHKIKATICTVTHSEKNFYVGCPDKACKKKLVQETYNWSCPTCNKTIEKPTYYYTLSFRIKDYSTEFWVDVFGDLGAKVFQMPCEEYKDIFLSNDTVKLKEISDKLEFKTFTFVGKPKVNTYQNQVKKKINIWRVEAVDPVIEARKLVKSLTQILNIKK